MSSEPRKAFVCPQCRETYGDPLYMARGRRCFGCWLDTFIPPNYQRREHYVYDSVWHHLNATRRPPLGVPFLDTKAGKLSEMLLMCKNKPRI